MPDARLEKARQAYDGGVCYGCGVRLDATVCRCAVVLRPISWPSFPWRRRALDELTRGIDWSDLDRGES